MLADAVYAELLRYLYVLSAVPVDVIARGAVAALVGTFVIAAWRLRAVLRIGRPATPRRENA